MNFNEELSIQAIDFNQPDAEFIFRGQTYQVKKYLEKYFFRDKLQQDYDFVYSFEYSELLLKAINASKPPSENDEPIISEIAIDDIYGLQRCIDYEDTIFCFSVLGYMNNEYCSFKSRYWIPFVWEPSKEIDSDDILNQPPEFFLNQAGTIYHDCDVEFFDLEELHPTFRDSYQFQGAESLSFACGSREELERLTRIAVTASVELEPLFEYYSVLLIHYTSFDGFTLILGIKYLNGESFNWYASEYDWYNSECFSEQLIQVLNSIFIQNTFTGRSLKPSGGCLGYMEYEHFPLAMNVEVKAPSPNQRQEALRELREWLEDKLTQEEIEFFFEGAYAINPPNPIQVSERLREEMERFNKEEARLREDEDPFIPF